MYPYPGREDYGLFVKRQIDSLTPLGIESDLVVINGYQSKLEYLRGIRLVNRALQSKQYDLVHVHYGLTLIPALGINNVPVIVSYYGSDVMDPVQWVFSRGLSSKAQTHIVKSEGMKRRLGLPSAIVMPEGIDLDLFRIIDKREARAKLGLLQEIPIVIFVANPARKVKRFDLAKRVVAESKKAIAGLQFFAVTGKLQDEVCLYCNAADVLLLTSKWEGSPNVVREATACGLPVVSTDVGDVREQLQGVTPSFVETDDPKKLAERVTQILSNPTRANGREKLEKSSLDQVAIRLITIYDKTIRKTEKR